LWVRRKYPLSEEGGTDWSRKLVCCERTGYFGLSGVLSSDPDLIHWSPHIFDYLRMYSTYTLAILFSHTNSKRILLTIQEVYCQFKYKAITNLFFLTLPYFCFLFAFPNHEKSGRKLRSGLHVINKIRIYTFSFVVFYCLGLVHPHSHNLRTKTTLFP